MNQLRVKCKGKGRDGKGCPYWLVVYEGTGGNDFRPMLVGGWVRIYRCPECLEEHLYTDGDVRGARGLPV